MGHHHGIRTHSFSFDALPHGFPSDPFSPLVDLFADPCGCHFDLGPTPFADAVADHCLGGAHQLGSVDCFLLDEQQERPCAMYHVLSSLLAMRNTGESVNSMKPYETKTNLAISHLSPQNPAKLVGFGFLLCLSVGSPFVSGIFGETLQDLTGAKTSAIQGEIAKAAQNTRAEKLSQRT
jgi:hypothetical protein